MKTYIKTLLITTVIIAGIVFIGLVIIYFLQDRLVFFPRKYGPDAIVIAQHYKKLEFETARNSWQFSYYLGPEDRLPKKLWILTGGNGSLALGWDFVSTPAAKKNPENGFLLVEYPGYGDCEGKPSRLGIQENMEGAVEALATFLQTDADQIKSRSSFLGHSLGCAVALEAAAKWKRGEVIAVSPFTSIKDMAGLTVSLPLFNLVRNRWDNRVSIETISKLDDAKITIFHGADDQVIPISMSGELAAPYPDTVSFITKNGMGHSDIVGKLRDELVKRIAE